MIERDANEETASAEAAKKPVKIPRLRWTVILAALLVWFDGYVSGQGILSLFVLIFGTPILLLRVLLARRNPDLRKRRLVSIPIYVAAAALALAMVKYERRATLRKAESIIDACERFKVAKGNYPQSLAELTPSFLAAVPTTRFGGFRYTHGAGPPGTTNHNVHVVQYTAMPPHGRAYFILEEKKWGFYD